MSNEYQLSYTASQIDEKLGKIDVLETKVNELSSNIGGGVNSGENVDAAVTEVTVNMFETDLLNWVYDTSTFSGWRTNWVFEQEMYLNKLQFRIRARDAAVTQVRVRIALDECSDSHVVFDSILDVNIPSGEDRVIACDVSDVKIAKGQMVHVGVDANQISTFYFNRVETAGVSYGYIQNGKLDESMTAPSVGGKYRLWLVASGYNVTGANFELDTTLTQSGMAADAKSVGDKFAEIEPGLVELVSESINLLDMDTMWTYEHWIYFTGTVGVGNEIGVLSNQYTTGYVAIKLPVYGMKSVTFSTNAINVNGTNSRNICVLGWYMADKSMKCLEYRYNIPAHELDIAESLTFNIPDGTHWLCLTLGNVYGIIYDGCWVMANEGDVALPYEPYGNTSNIKLKAYGKILLTDETPVKSNIRLKLPSKYALVVGDTFEMFYKGIVNAVNPDMYYVEVQCGIGAAYAKRFICTPQNVGDYTMTVKLYDQEHNLLDEKTVTLSVKAKMATSPSSETVVLYVGDSLASGGGVPGEFKRRLTATDGSPVGDGLSNISFIGTCNGNGADYEGYGGYSLNTYTTEGKGNTFMWITTTHDKTDDDQHSIYKDTSGGQWKLETIEAERIKLIRTAGYVLPSTGTLTWVSGGVNHSGSRKSY